MLQVLGPLGDLTTVLLGLLALAVVILVGRFVLNVAWKLVLVATLIVGVLWGLGTAGIVF